MATTRTLSGIAYPEVCATYAYGKWPCRNGGDTGLSGKFDVDGYGYELELF